MRCYEMAAVIVLLAACSYEAAAKRRNAVACGNVFGF
jgi:hypothetical protein